MNEQAYQQAPQTAPPEAPAKSGGGCKKLAIGCGIVALILVIILIIGGWFVAKNFRSWTASGFATVVNKAVEQSTLPDEQKQTIKDRVDYVKDEFVAGNITIEEMGRAIENLKIENLIGAGMTQYVGSGLIESSQLSDEQKAEGKQALNRVAQGLLDGQISLNDAQQTLTPIMQNPGSNDWQLKTNPTQDELKQVMDNATDLADQAGVPEDVGEVDFAAKVNEAFDQALGIQQP